MRFIGFENNSSLSLISLFVKQAPRFLTHFCLSIEFQQLHHLLPQIFYEEAIHHLHLDRLLIALALVLIFHLLPCGLSISSEYLLNRKASVRTYRSLARIFLIFQYILEISIFLQVLFFLGPILLLIRHIGVRDFNNPPDRSLITAMSCIDVHGFFHIFHWKKAIFYC